MSSGPPSAGAGWGLVTLGGGVVPGTTAFALGFGVGAFAVVAHIAGLLAPDGGLAAVVPFG